MLSVTRASGDGEHISLGVRKASGPEEPRQLVGVLWQLRKAGVADGLGLTYIGCEEISIPTKTGQGGRIVR